MPDITIAPELLIPPYPLHFLTIIRYISLLVVLLILFSPGDGGLAFLILLGVTALLIVADIYGSAVIPNRFTVFLFRIFAVVIPILLAGTAGPNKSARQAALVLAFLGMPAVAIMLFIPQIDPVFF